MFWTLVVLPWSHGPWKPELFKFKPPDPWRPRRVTIFAYVNPGNPPKSPSNTVTGWLAEESVQLAMPSGKLPYLLSLFIPYGFGALPYTKIGVVFLNFGDSPPAFKPQASALSSIKTKKSALDK